MKKNNFILILLLFIIIFFINKNIYAQANDSNYVPFVKNANNEQILEIAKNVYGDAWIEFKDNLNIDPSTIFTNYKTAFGLTNNDQMILENSFTDDLGITHDKYQQYHNSIKVEGAEYIIHSMNNKIIRANGKLVENINILAVPIIDSISAFQIVFDSIKKIRNTTINSPTNKLEIVYTKKDNSLSLLNTNYKLSYKFTIESLDFIIYVDAINGKIIKLLHDIYGLGCQTGQVKTMYYGDKNDEIYKTCCTGFLKSYYVLECGGFITKYYHNGSYIEEDNFNSYWGDNNDRPSATVHWAAQQAANYFFNTFQRWGPDGNGNTVQNYVGGPDLENSTDYIGHSYPNLNPQEIYIGPPISGSWSSPASLEIVGHEYTHCVVYHMANLDPSNTEESGALGESFADIFGKMTECYALNYFTNWEMGSNFIYSTAHDSKRRNFANPSIYDGASYYGDAYWVNSIGSINESHLHAGVQNHWFYLLSQGDTYNGYTITGIGMSKVAGIAYRNLNCYLISNSDYSDAKNASICSAMDLYGSCSFEAEQTIKAWNAVNVTSIGGMYADYSVNCTNLNSTHVNGSIYTANAINDLYIDCSVNNYSNASTILTAGNSVKMLSGFKTNGTYFHAFINPCLANNHRLTNPNNQNQTLNSDSISQINIKKRVPNSFILMPNPNDGNFSIGYEISELETAILKIYDITGRQVFTETLKAGKSTLSINASKLEAGVYFYRATVENKILGGDKIIVIK